MERTAEMYADIVKTGPYSEVAPQAQLNIGTAREKQKTLGFKPPTIPLPSRLTIWPPTVIMTSRTVASEAIFRAGLACEKQAQTADRDQTTAGQAIAKFTDFMALYPNDPRVPEAQKIIASLRERTGARQLRHRPVLREAQEVGGRPDLLQRGPVAGSQLAVCDRGAATN